MDWRRKRGQSFDSLLRFRQSKIADYGNLGAAVVQPLVLDILVWKVLREQFIYIVLDGLPPSFQFPTVIGRPVDTSGDDLIHNFRIEIGFFVAMGSS